MSDAVSMSGIPVENPFGDVLSENAYLRKSLGASEGQRKDLSVALEEERNEVSILEAELRTVVEQLEKSEFARKTLSLQVAELEEKCQDLTGQLEEAKRSENLIRREFDVLAAQMEIVHLICGGNKCGGCG